MAMLKDWRIYLLVLCLFSTTPLFSQLESFESKLFLNDSLNTSNTREKIFVHHDKPYYKLRDTIWLKGYIVSATEHLLSDSSKLAYVEIINAQDEVVRRISTPCYTGLFASNIALSEKIFRQGRYRLRAYTKYLRNFGDSLFFETNVNIIDPSAEEWNTTVKQLDVAANRFRILATFRGQGTQGLANQTISLRLRSGNKTVLRFNTRTDYLGNILIDTVLKETTVKDLQLEVTSGNALKLQMPVPVSDGPSIDLQFMPEGGSFIGGVHQRLGFKAIDAFGKSVKVKGVVKESQGQIIANFVAIHNGMGVVSFTPKAGEQYIAELENGQRFNLPPVFSSGIAFQVLDLPQQDSIRMKITVSPDLVGKRIYFAAATRGITAVRGKLIAKATPFELVLDRGKFHSGVTVFTLYDDQLLPINGRAVFIWQKDDLRLSLSSHKTSYLHKDSVSLTLNALDSSGNKINGNFSIAVIDTSQVKMPASQENLLTYMLLSSDLSGKVEDAAYYFDKPDPEAMDALMLTQGWVSYHRNNIALPFDFEKGFVVDGHVSNIFNKGLSSVKVLLFGKAGREDAFIMDTVTNEKGDFRFNKFNYFETDSVSMMLKATNKRGKDFNVGIELKEASYPAIKPGNSARLLGDILMDTTAHAFVSTQEQIKSDLKKDGIFLEEVFVTAKRKIAGSKNLNTDGGADQTIDEETLNKTPKESLLHLLEKQVKGFRLASPPRSRSLMYMINSNIVRLVIDGVNLHFFFQPVTGQRDEYALFLRSYLDYFTAEDVKGIEIMNNPRHNSSYRTEYLTIGEQMSSGPISVDYSFIEITTRSGQGPLQKKTPGVYLLRPVYPFMSRQFYSPRYATPDQKTVFPDLRNTVYWNPDMVTDSTGKARVSFYTSESKTNSYLVIIQGMDLYGNIGVMYQPLKIARESVSPVESVEL